MEGEVKERALAKEEAEEEEEQEQEAEEEEWVEGRVVRLELRMAGPWTTPVEEPVVGPRDRRCRLKATATVFDFSWAFGAGLLTRLYLCSSALRRNLSPSTTSLCSRWASAGLGQQEPRRGSNLWSMEGKMSAACPTSRKVVGAGQSRGDWCCSRCNAGGQMHAWSSRLTESEIEPLLTVSPKRRATLSRKGIVNLAFDLAAEAGGRVGVGPRGKAELDAVERAESVDEGGVVAVDDDLRCEAAWWEVEFEIEDSGVKGWLPTDEGEEAEAEAETRAGVEAEADGGDVVDTDGRLLSGRSGVGMWIPVALALVLRGRWGRSTAMKLRDAGGDREGCWW